MTIKEAKARLQDAQLRGKQIMLRAQTENREPTEQEERDLDAIKKELDAYKKKVDYLESFIGEESKPSGESKSKRKADDEDDSDEERDSDDDEDPPKSEPNKKEEKSFRTLGEQMVAVHRASMPGGLIDRRLSTRAATGLGATNPTDGGFLVQTQFVKDLLKRTYDTGILARRCHKIPITTNANSLKINAIDEVARTNGSRWGGIQTYWQDEAEKFIASKPKFRQIELSLKRLSGLCYITEELLADTTALESVVSTGFSEEFGFKIDDAIIRGTGAGQPLGILNSNALVKAEKHGDATHGISVETLIGMWARLWSRSRANACWFINPEIEPLLYTLKLGDNPVYIPAGSMANAPYSTLLGRPVIPIEQASEVGQVGDIMLADLSQYLIIDKGGINTASSVHVRFLYEEEVFRFIYRMDGQPTWHQPLTPNKSSKPVSPFVALAKR